MNTQKNEPFFTTLKGICILVVLLLHSRGAWDFDAWDYFYKPDSLNYTYWLVMWQLLKPVVGIFIFLAGYFINQERLLQNPKNFYAKKFHYIVIPFLVFSMIYTMNQHIRYHLEWNISIVEEILLGRNGIQLYYVIALLQLFILAYIIVKYLDFKIVAITCFTLSLLYSIVFQHYYMTTFQTTWYEMYFFINWLFYFYLGIYLRKHPEFIERMKCSTINLLLCVTLLLNLVHGFFIEEWTHSATIVSSQIGITNFFYTISLCLWLFKFREIGKKYCTNKFLLFVGNQCYFIFLSHWLFQQYFRIWSGNNTSLIKFLPLCQLVDVIGTLTLCTIAWYFIRFIRKCIS